jgi:ABC-type nitrate/sulfonate/bicarbonate transport system permease component
VLKFFQNHKNISMITFTIPAFALAFVIALLAGVVFGVWLLLNKIK